MAFSKPSAVTMNHINY
ncbi:hypothetical protein PPL_08756 [Heterostelium album PN500]|uniref:Uncharacterized protein n=1 Tax=Heterostelium pallidum (strain ATCC 26659 / Pp 5 / PN500) TaxID=670386 RepID=D3BJM8_HETP5|nr:hypothetical protein PPL_08756 [Heterostelium album PN500]